MDTPKFICASVLAVGTGTAVFFIWRQWYEKRKHVPPAKWRKVGELGNLMIFPVKSFGPVYQKEVECTVLGPRSGWMRDRTLVLVDLNGKYVTAKNFPATVQIFPTVTDSKLILRAGGMTPMTIDLAKIREKNIRALITSERIDALDCGDEVACWLSRLLMQDESGLRLVYFPFERSSRDVKKKYAPFPLVEKTDTGAFPDETSYMMINDASIDDLNDRIDEPVTALQFRPNFVVKGAGSLAEDDWDWVKIGNVVFRNIRPCTRCIFTTIDPETGTKHPNFEPLKALRKYRLVADPKVRAFVHESPAMGIHLALRGPPGVVHLGDSIYVGVADKNET